jgi:hypothetical protein
MRRYREDSERVIRIGNHFVRRPAQAERVPETWGEAIRRNWPEIVFGALILLTFWLGIPWLAGMAA